MNLSEHEVINIYMCMFVRLSANEHQCMLCINSNNFYSMMWVCEIKSEGDCVDVCLLLLFL